MKYQKGIRRVQIELGAITCRGGGDSLVGGIAGRRYKMCAEVVVSLPLSSLPDNIKTSLE